MKKLFIFICASAFLSCNDNTSDKPAKQVSDTTSRGDQHSFGRPALAFVKHLDLELDVNFETKQLTGKASWTFENPGKADSILLDTKQLQINKITGGAEEKELKYSITAGNDYMGSGLSVPIDSSFSKINIYYKTLPEAAALQWLAPQQTAGKKHPFLFTQSQAVLARTWIPCQDGPGVRFTYTAKVAVPTHLLAAMSSAGNPQQKNAEGIYIFKQENPIPSYLMALAVGDIEFKAVDARTGVYAEPLTLLKAAEEFEDMGKMVTAAEQIYGPYKWGRYDLLVLPPSFPFGGMENPMLTFATPTVIAGDKSLVSLVAHELAHSWSGNLVTNATWNDFWLNEGFTTYFERRIVEAVYGKEDKEMQEVLGFQDLKDELKDFGNDNPDTRLKLDLNGRDPDLGVSSIAYEKGYLFIRKIEEVVGRAALDSFLNKYFAAHEFKSITTETFLKYLDENLLNSRAGAKDSININAWIYQPGLPANLPAIRSDKFNRIDTFLSSFKQMKSFRGMKNKIQSTNERLYFLRHLPDDLTIEQMRALDNEFSFTNSGNAEIQAVWYTLSARLKYEPAYDAMENFLINVGRRKFLTPLYKELAKTPEGKARAIQIYALARKNYHSVSYRTIDDILK